MNRRHFILTPVLFAVGNCFADDHDHGQVNSSPQPLSADTHELLRLLKNSQSAAELGRQYLSDKPELANEAILNRAVGVNNQQDHASAKRLFEAQLVLDFESGNIQCIDGWVLSNAEVSLCALAAMATSNS